MDRQLILIMMMMALFASFGSADIYDTLLYTDFNGSDLNLTWDEPIDADCSQIGGFLHGNNSCLVVKDIGSYDVNISNYDSIEYNFSIYNSYKNFTYNYNLFNYYINTSSDITQGRIELRNFIYINGDVFLQVVCFDNLGGVEHMFSDPSEYLNYQIDEPENFSVKYNFNNYSLMISSSIETKSYNMSLCPHSIIGSGDYVSKVMFYAQSFLSGTFSVSDFDYVSITGILDTCDPDWSCDGYDECVDPATNVSCNSVTDLNSCNTTYTGDYTEFEVQTCCYANYTCIGYEACVSPAVSAACNTVYDINICNQTYTGNYSEFASTFCSYGGGGGGGGFPEPEQVIVEVPIETIIYVPTYPDWYPEKYIPDIIEDNWDNEYNQDTWEDEAGSYEEMFSDFSEVSSGIISDQPLQAISDTANVALENPVKMSPIVILMMIAIAVLVRGKKKP